MRALSRIVVAVVCLIASDDSSADSHEHPNVIFFLVDDLGWRDVGCFGSSFYDTPSVDRLASQR